MFRRVLQGRAAEVWRPLSSCCIRPEEEVRFSRSEQTAGVSPEQRAVRQAAASDPEGEESLRG